MNSIKIGILILLLSTAAPVYATTVSITDTTVEPDGIVTIPIVVNDITDYGSGTINIEYDPSVVHVTDVTSSPDSQVAAYNPNNTIGLVRISTSNVYGANGDIALANVEFTAVGLGSTPLNLDVVSLYDRSFNKISVTPNDGSIMISANGGTTSPTPTSDDGSNGGSTTGTISTSTPTPTPTLESTPAETPHPDGDGAHPAPAPESVPHDEATATSTYTPSTVKPAPSSQMSTPGFEIALLITGFLVASLILRRNNE